MGTTASTEGPKVTSPTTCPVCGGPNQMILLPAWDQTGGMLEPERIAPCHHRVRFHWSDPHGRILKGPLAAAARLNCHPVAVEPYDGQPPIGTVVPANGLFVGADGVRLATQ